MAHPRLPVTAAGRHGATAVLLCGTLLVHVPFAAHAGAVPTATETPVPASTPTATPSLPADLAGVVRYTAADRPVAGVGVFMLGDMMTSTLSDVQGAYEFPFATAGDLALEPRKLGDFHAAITSFDAVAILEYVAGLRTLSDDQLLAADATASGTVSTFDAVRILELQAGVIARLPAGELCGSDWLFVPVAPAAPGQSAIAPAIGDDTCTLGRLTFAPLAPPLAGRDFRAVLIGDVTGNWQPNGP